MSNQRLINAGATLANIAFNLAQRDPGEFTARDVAALDQARKDWDAARSEPEATPAPGAPGQEAAAVQAVGAWPAELPLRLQVSYSPGDWDTFVYGVSGHLSMDVLTEIEAAIRGEDAEALFEHGPGDYLLSASHFAGQYGPEGRCEWAPCWEFDVEGFRPPAVDPAALPPSGAGEKTS